MSAGKNRGEGFTAYRSPDTMKFIGSNRHTDTCATNENAKVKAMGLNGFGNEFRVTGIIGAFFVVRAKILIFN